jgi:hypothetical protein
MDVSRQKYYASLGVKSIEISSTLDAVIAEQSRDKLVHLCQTSRLPHLYRSLVWKILLNVFPIDRLSWDVVQTELNVQYEMLHRAIGTILKTGINEELTADIMVKMYYLYEFTGSPFDCADRIVSSAPQWELTLAQVFLDIFEVSEQDALWIFIHFMMKRESPVSNLELVHEKCGDLIKHLETLEIDVQKHTSYWYQTFFACVFSIEILESLWDIVISGGASTFLPFLEVCCLLAIEKKLLRCNTKSAAVDVIANVQKYIDHYHVGATAIMMWQDSKKNIKLGI